MTPRRPSPPFRRRAGFTLIELVGVLAIVAILASVVAPNALRAIERAAVKAEVATLGACGDQLRSYLRTNGTLPTSANWTTTLGTFASLSPADLATNRRRNARVLVFDPAANPAPRAIFLSSMRAGLALPQATDISTAARFQNLWQTADGAVPTTASWSGWSAWSAVAGAGEFLVIERVNLTAIYQTDLLAQTITLNNRGPGTTSYNLVLPNGTTQSAVNVAAGANAVLTNLRPRTRVNLYRAAGGATLNYSYVVSTTGRTFDYDGTNWIPQ